MIAVRARTADADRPAAPLLVAALLASGLLAAPAPVAGQEACDLRLQPPEVPVQEAAVLVSAGATADPGELRSVEFPTRSGVVVLNAAPAPDRDDVVARIALDTYRASPGRWSVVLRGSEADCRGTLVVVGEAG